MVTYQGMYEGLFVYTSPFAEGTLYISVLTVSDTAISELASTLHERLTTINFETQLSKSSISTCISKLLPQLRDLATLSITLAHQDLSPFNYLIDESTARGIQHVGQEELGKGSNLRADSLQGQYKSLIDSCSKNSFGFLV